MNHTKEQHSSSDLNFLSVIRFLYRWKYPLIIITLLGGIVAFVLASPPITEPKYRSSVIFYPAVSSSVSKALLGDNPGDNTDFLSFGEEEEAEQLLQVLQSGDIKTYIRNKYDLMTHYDIDEDAPYPNYRFNEKWQNNISFDKTQYMSIKVSVLDKDPEMAASIANDIVRWVDSVKTRMQRKRAFQALKIVEKEYKEKQNHIQKMIDSLQKLGEQGVINAEEQSVVLTEAYAQARLAGNRQAMQEIQEKLSALAKYGPIQQSLSERMIFELDDLTELRQKYEQTQVDAREQMSHTFIIDEATPTERKAYPIRSLIVFLTMLGTFLLTCIVFIFIDNYREMKRSIANE